VSAPRLTGSAKGELITHSRTTAAKIPHAESVCVSERLEIERESLVFVCASGGPQRSCMSHCIHHVPGRLRVRSGSFHCRGDCQKELLALGGVREVRMNSRAGSITVHYDPEQLTRGRLLALLEEHGCIGARTRDHDAAARVGELFGKAFVGAWVNKAIERSALKLVSVLL